MRELDYRHPREEEKLHRLLKSPVIQAVLGAYQEIRAGTSEFARLRNRNFLVTESSSPVLYRLYRQARRRVGVTEPIPLYLEFDYGYTARAEGTDGNCALLLSGRCLEEMDSQELLALLGSQLAHIRFGHVKYLQVSELLDQLLRNIPFVGGAAGKTAGALLLDWKQCAQMTADRGGAVAAGSADAVCRMLQRRMGGSLKNPGADLTGGEALYDGVCTVEGTAAGLVMQNVLRQVDVPFGSRRILHLQKWAHSQWCRQNLPHIYYGSRRGTEYDTNTSGEEDFRQSVLCSKTEPEKSLFLLHGAAGKGWEPAMTRLGLCYLKGQNGLPRRMDTGVDYIRRAALKGDPDGQYILGRLYRQGAGRELERNPQMGEWLLRTAFGQGQMNAAAELETAPLQVYCIPSEKLKRLFEYAGGCRPVSEEAREKLRKWLWIPRQDVICAAETQEDADENPQAIALCDTGIYLRKRGEMPGWITWKLFLTENPQITVHSGLLELTLKERHVWNSQRAGDPAQIVQKLAAAAKACRRGGI